jgi:membrane-associated phospholipid phosphatase
MPLWDDTLNGWDRALGLDWRAYLDLINERPVLGLCLTLAYQSILPQSIVACVALGLGGRSIECRAFVAAFMISAVVSILISGFTPATAMFVHLGLQPQDYPNLHPAAAFVHVSDLNALRDGSLRVISLSTAEGIITFPSFHAALAVVFAFSFWSVRRLRWPAVILNLLMLAATPIDGGHYFVDVIAGTVIAIASIASVWALRTFGQTRPASLTSLGDPARA